MKITLGQSVEILANLGVVAGLVFLGLEIRQNTELLESEIVATRHFMRTEDFLLPLEYPDLATALIKNHNGQELSEYQQLILNRAMATMLHNWQFVYTQYAKGRIEQESIPVKAWRRAFLGDDISGTGYWPDLSDFWIANRVVFTPEFAAWMESNIVNQ
jgi:hypothetical protein